MNRSPLYSVLPCLLFLILFQAFLTPTLGQQVIVTDDESYLSGSSHVLLELYAKDQNKGLLIPRLSSTDRLNLIPDSSELGLLIFDQTSRSFWYWGGSAWHEIMKDSQQPLRIDQLEDLDMDTRVAVESQTDEDIIRFDVGGTEAMRIDSSGRLHIHAGLQWTNSPLIVGLRSDLSLTDSDSTLITEGAVKAYIESLPLPHLLSDADEDTQIRLESTQDSDSIHLIAAGTSAIIVTDSLTHIQQAVKIGETIPIEGISDGPLSDSDSTIATERSIKAYIDGRPSPSMYVSVMEYGVKGDGQTDDTDSLAAAIADNPGGTLFFPDGEYKANLVIPHRIRLLSLSGNVRIFSDQVGTPVLHVQAPLVLDGLSFEHIDISDGSHGLYNDGFDIEARQSSFKAYEHYVAPDTSHSRFDQCTFTCTDESFGSVCWSPNAVFTNCIFDGVVGADVQDSKFYYCNFSGLWGIHMPDGEINNTGGSTGFEGNGEFHHCEIRGSYYYAIGLGNKAHAKMYNCVVIGFTSGAYARTASTFEAYNCFIACTKTGGASTAVKFAKYITPDKDAIGLIDEGISYFSNCRFQNLGSPSGFQMIVPNKDTAGQVFLSQCGMDMSKFCTEDPTGICTGDIFQYITIEAGADQVVHETRTVTNNEILTPTFSGAGISYLDITGDGGPASGLRIHKWYQYGKEYPLGYRLVIRCGSSTNTVSIKNGYYAPVGAGVSTSNGSDLTLGANESVVFVYTKNFWVQTSNNHAVFTDQYGNVNIDGTLAVDLGTTINEFSTDGTLSDASNLAIPTELAVKTYVDELVQLESQIGVNADGNLSIDLPAGYRLATLVLEETADHSAGTVRIGSSPGGDDIMSDIFIDAEALIDADLKKSVLSLSINKTLYISSSGWGNGELNIYARLEKVL